MEVSRVEVSRVEASRVAVRPAAWHPRPSPRKRNCERREKPERANQSPAEHGGQPCVGGTPDPAGFGRHEGTRPVKAEPRGLASPSSAARAPVESRDSHGQTERGGHLRRWVAPRPTARCSKVRVGKAGPPPHLPPGGFMTGPQLDKHSPRQDEPGTGEGFDAGAGHKSSMSRVCFPLNKSGGLAARRREAMHLKWRVAPRPTASCPEVGRPAPPPHLPPWVDF